MLQQVSETYAVGIRRVVSKCPLTVSSCVCAITVSLCGINYTPTSLSFTTISRLSAATIVTMANDFQH